MICLEIGRDNKLKDTSSNYLVSAKSLRVSNEFRNVSNGSLIFIQIKILLSLSHLQRKRSFFQAILCLILLLSFGYIEQRLLQEKLFLVGMVIKD